MARPLNPDLNRPWKLLMPATLAGRVEFALADPIHQKPIYGARNTLVIALIMWWLERESGTPPEELPPIPTLAELRAKVS